VRFAVWCWWLDWWITLVVEEKEDSMMLKVDGGWGLMM